VVGNSAGRYQSRAACAQGGLFLPRRRQLGAGMNRLYGKPGQIWQLTVDFRQDGLGKGERPDTTRYIGKDGAVGNVGGAPTQFK
jgi:hypothetical protein